MTAWLRTALVLPALLLGCAGNPMPEIRQDFYQGRYGEARAELLELERDDPSDRHVYRLERSIVELARGEPDAAEQALRTARDRLEELSSSDAMSWLGAVLLDDRQLDYGGADYEKVLVRAVLAVANLMRGGNDADAYALQVLEKQLEIIDSFETDDGFHPKKAYKLVAFGSYLRAILAENDPLRIDVARREFERVAELEPRFPFAEADLERVTRGKHSEKGNGVVHVIAFVGRGPFRVESEEPVSGRALAIAQVIWASARGRVTFPNVAAVKIPAMAYWQDNPSEVHVSVDGEDAGSTAVITDVELTAQKEFEAMKSYIVARAVLRRAFKITVTEGVKEAFRGGRRRRYDSDDALRDLAISLGGLLWTAMEGADLRCWSLLPATFQVLRVEMPAGEHELAFRAGREGRPAGPAQRVRVLVRDGVNSYVLVQTPTFSGGPPPLTSEPLEEEKIR